MEQQLDTRILLPNTVDKHKISIDYNIACGQADLFKIKYKKDYAVMKDKSGLYMLCGINYAITMYRVHELIYCTRTLKVN